ncbi:MAG: DUF4244 domain-containing protein [Promicromonosporaceae bacterium]|nr:DUF4244 domain-containing protein [Promicromonosporaceae bacterium]
MRSKIRELFGWWLAPTELEHELSPRLCGEAGMATAEYAIATIAAVGLAGLLIVILKSDMVRGLLERIISSALSIG